ncbi:MAG: rod shape-determining protein RodA [bacterium]
MADERYMLRNFDLPFALNAIVLMVIGVAMIYSATANDETTRSYYLRQMLFIAVSVTFAIIVVIVDYEVWGNIAYGLYGTTLFALMLLFLLGRVNPAFTRWFRLGAFGVQPSEFAKVATILALAKYLDGRRGEPRLWKDLLAPSLIVGVPALMIVVQPDLGTGLVFLPILLIALYVGGTPLEHLSVIVASIAIAAGTVLVSVAKGWTFRIMYLLGAVGAVALLLVVAYCILRAIRRRPDKGLFIIIFLIFFLGLTVAFMMLRLLDLYPYQKERLVSLVNPEQDPRGIGWSIKQSITAIGSGGLGGKGFMRGTTSQLGFLPSRHTDFIFAVVGEEWGFLGAVVVLLLYFSLIARGIFMVSQARDMMGRVIVAGCISVIAAHVIVNIGMTIGIMPVTGLPLPFLSYGGSWMLTTSIMVGLILNVRMRKGLFV